MAKAPSLIWQDNVPPEKSDIVEWAETIEATKAPKANPTFTGTVTGVTKAMVGLGNVDNTADVNKPARGLSALARPGDHPTAFGNSLTALWSGQGAVSGTVLADDDMGRSLQVTGAAIVAARDVVPVLPGRMYQAVWVFKRTTDSTDPLGDAIVTGVQYLDGDHASNGAYQPAQTAFAAQGQRIVGPVTFSLDNEDADVTIPAGTTYLRPYLQTYGTSVVTLIGWIELQENRIAGPVDAALAALAAAASAVVANESANDAALSASDADADRIVAQAAAANAQSSARTCATWVILNGLTGASVGQGAEVLDSDTGTHTDPVVGGTVSNAGRYTWSASPAGWQRIGGTGLSAKADATVVSAISDRVNVATRAAANLYNPADPGNIVGSRLDTTATPTAVAGYRLSHFIPVTAGVSYAMSAHYSRVWFNAAGAVISAFNSGYPAGSYTAPAGAVSLRVSYQDAIIPMGVPSFVVAGSYPTALLAPFGQRADETRLFDVPVAALSGKVGPDKLSMFAPGKNLFNPAKRTIGYFYTDGFGQAIANATYSYSDWIPVVAGQQYKSNFPMRFVFLGDTQRQILTGVNADTTTFTAAQNGWARITIYEANAAGFQLEAGAVSTTFEPFGYDGRTALPTGEAIRLPSPAGATLVTTLDAHLGSSDWRGGVRPSSYGRERLRETRQRLRSAKAGKTGVTAQMRAAFIGDSFTHDTGRYARKIFQALTGKYGGYIGLGYHSFGGFGGAYPNGDVDWNSRAVVVSGTWDSSAYATGGGPDICQTVGPTSAMLRFQGNVDHTALETFTLLAEGGSGVIRHSWDGGATWQANTNLAGLAAGLQTVTLGGKPSTGAGEFRIEVVTGPATLYGVDIRKAATAGVLVHKLGATGSRAQQWAAVNATRFQAGIAALTPDLIVIMHGTNDQGSGRTKAQYKADIQTIVTRCRTARPTADILLVAPPENNRVGNAIAMTEYATALYELSLSLDVAYLDLQPFFGVANADYASGSARPWFNADLVHPEPDFGGYAMADAILQFMGEGGA